jgi:hypothetical protein
VGGVSEKEKQREESKYPVDLNTSNLMLTKDGI